MGNGGISPPGKSCSANKLETFQKREKPVTIENENNLVT